MEKELQEMLQLTCNFISKKARDLILAVFLLLIGQQLVNKLPDHLFCWRIQYREDIHNQSVYISKKKKLSGFTQRSGIFSDKQWKNFHTSKPIFL